MSRYRFRLEQVLRIRRTELDLARQSLLQANRALAGARHAVATDHERYRQLRRPMGPMAVAEFHHERTIATLAATTLAAAAAKVVRAEAEVDLRRDDWIQAGQRVQALERLDERRREEFRVAENLKEIATVDDLVAARWISPLDLVGDDAAR